jgi:uncharacterized caspase-like protein
MMRAAVVLLLLLLPTAVQAQKRVALVVGNSSYQHAGELANPKNDAADMAASLRSVGFQVLEGYDLNKAALDRKIRDFATALRGAQAGLFFYAGHGLQVSGQNYIVPVDAELTTEAALDFEMVRLELVHRTMEREAPTNILFLDACRNNPLARNLARAMGTRSAVIGRGLAAVESGAGTLISFSTQPGNVALDGAGRNSPFAGALVKHMSSSQDDLGSILIAVRNDVMQATQNKQVPWEHSAMTGRFYFRTPATIQVIPFPPPSQEAERAWELVKETRSAAVLEAFIARYKGTLYGALASERLEQLKSSRPQIQKRTRAAKLTKSDIVRLFTPFDMVRQRVLSDFVYKPDESKLLLAAVDAVHRAFPPTPMISIAGRSSEPRWNSVAVPVKMDLTTLHDVALQILNDEGSSDNDVRLVAVAIDGMLASLDLSSDHWDARAARTMETLAPIGIELTRHENGLFKVVAPIDDTPAAKAGIMANDIITHLDEQPVQGLTFSQVI